jgi:hypothetical protein
VGGFVAPASPGAAGAHATLDSQALPRPLVLHYCAPQAPPEAGPVLVCGDLKALQCPARVYHSVRVALGAVMSRQAGTGMDMALFRSNLPSQLDA